jgi:hypothetical protein
MQCDPDWCTGNTNKAPLWGATWKGGCTNWDYIVLILYMYEFASVYILLLCVDCLKYNYIEMYGINFTPSIFSPLVNRI